MTDEKLIAELLEACETAVWRIEHLNTGTEGLGPDPTVVQLKKAIRNAKKHSQKAKPKKSGSAKP